ncbi:DUF4229 domain-containing protein [Phycicoccus sonneratiae]|uniref:DUF4229 domain-containing protein n=1 Tax=Phycicoccus sonneratiae TaxID=2807628 RepID=A0ABS2CJ68_9MICO|nr:DUF4229 domain-containing protein [Phycicoccus sonneraticus]MBM6399914.1 DUF4229 domain-containing protein [Phycicoccus sonneraticus]
MNAVLRYSVLRLMIFLGCLLVLWLVGLRDEEDYVLLVVLAALASMVISYVALRRFREAYSDQLARTVERRAAARRERAGHPVGDEEAEDAEVGSGSGGSLPASRAEGAAASGSGGAAASASSGEDDDFR